jgi:hypothetical protein
MQSVLSIDISADKPQAMVVRVDQALPEIQEVHELPAELLLELNGKGSTELGQETGSSALRSLIERVQTPWTNAVVVLPPSEYLSLNLDLPFFTGKNVSKILDLEIQDKVPFSTDEFTLHPNAVGQLASKEQDFHVGLLPRVIIKRVLSTLRGGKVEPLVLTTPSAALSALTSLPQFQESASALFVLPTAQYLAVACKINGTIRADRIIARRTTAAQPTELELSSIHELRLTILAWQDRYKLELPEVILLSETIDSKNVQLALGCPVRCIRPSTLAPSADAASLLGAWSALFGRDEHPPTALSNFRTREFAYSPQLAELAAGLSTLLPFFVATIGLLLITLSATYLLREHRISRLEDGIQSQVQQAIPTLMSPAGRELDALEGENRKLEQQLQSLGSLSALNPLDYFAEIAEDLPLATGITVTRVKIEGTKLKVEGTAPGYAELEKAERMLKRKKNVYCKIRKEAAGATPGRPNARGYTLDISLCE